VPGEDGDGEEEAQIVKTAGTAAGTFKGFADGFAAGLGDCSSPAKSMICLDGFR
jgi:hypothetical protein